MSRKRAHATAVAILAATMVMCGPIGQAWADQGGSLLIEPAKLPAKQIDLTGWSEPKQIDGRRCLIAQKGRDAWLQVEAWWPKGMRPAEGQYWMAEILYKDTATQPIRFSVFAGLERYEGRTEMHRFGGLNDGKWKLAKVPLPWDMLLVRPHTRWAEMSVHSPGGDVPVASIRIVPLPKDKLADAAERWNAETRDWIRRVQKRHAGKPHREYAKPQEPAPAVAKSGDAVVPYVRSWMQPVYPYSAPQAGELGKPIRVQMALNEYEPATFGVYAAAGDLTNVQVRVEPVRCVADPNIQLDVEVRTAEYSLVRNGRRLAVFPQRLWPTYPTSIAKGKSGWFWLTFKSDEKKTRPGVYRGRAIITADQGTASLQIEVKVLPIRLLEMNETDLLMGGCITGMVSRHDMDEMLRHNHNMVNLWFSGVPPKFIPKGKGDFDLDFTILDAFMEQARKAGIRANVYFLGGNPYGFPRTMTLERELAREVLGLTLEQYDALINRDRYNIPPEIVPLYKKWVRKVWKHAKEKNWPELILTPFDEPDKWRQRRNGTGPWIRPHFEQGCKLIHEAAPDCRVYASIHHAPGILFLPVIDIFCTNAISEDPLLGEKVRAAGKVFWQYSGIGNGLPDRARFAFGFYFNAFNSRGSLCWAYNWGRRFDTTEGNNWMYAWYTPLEMIPAPFYEGMREAWDDRRYVETLKNLAKQHNVDVSDFLAQIAETGKTQRGPGGRDTVNDFWAQAKRVGVMDELRNKVADKILEILRKASAARL